MLVGGICGHSALEISIAVQNSTSNWPTGNDIARYRTNYLSEREGVYLYSGLAEAERDEHLAELYRGIANIEERHANLVGHLQPHE